MSDQELIPVIDATTSLALFTEQNAKHEPTGLNPLLQKVRDAINAFQGDVSTPSGRAAIASMAFRVSKAKAALEAEGKRLADEQKEIPKKIDAARRHMKETLDRWRDEVRQPLTDWESAEAARVNGHKAKIAAFEALVAEASGSVADIRAKIEDVEAFVVGLDCEEFAAEYARARDAALASLRIGLKIQQKREDEQAELAALREQAAKREEAERAEALRREGEERARRELAEKQEREAAARREEEARKEVEAEAERQEFIRRHQEQQRQIDEANKRAEEAAAAERKRIEDEQAAAAAEVERREANRRHVATVNRAIVAKLIEVCGIDEAAAKKVVTAIAKHEIPRVAIQY